MAAMRVSFSGCCYGFGQSLPSRAFTELPVTWASRTEEANGRTSPEELLAAVYDGRRFEDGKPIARTIGKEAA